jgi:hypothetical protein
MFDLDREVSMLARKTCGSWFSRRAYQAEIEDYLHCVVEDHVANGATQEAAFEIARKQLGSIESLRGELEQSSRPTFSWAASKKLAFSATAALLVGGLILRLGLSAGWTMSHVLAFVSATLKWITF